ncbi:MAG TPA: cytochrome c [Acidisoma sp.]|jgi:cytochrome c553|nr:cytochrome c [Acidisoma sp.]
MTGRDRSQRWQSKAGAAAAVLALGIGVAAAFHPGAAWAASPPPAMAPLCASCHGPQGVSASPTIPNLAGQKAGYLENALSAYKAGQRQGGMASMMNGIATHLSDSDITALSTYYASLTSN